MLKRFSPSLIKPLHLHEETNLLPLKANHSHPSTSASRVVEFNKKRKHICTLVGLFTKYDVRNSQALIYILRLLLPIILKPA